MGTERIPAWKRLGLRLKFANENASTTQPGGGVEKRKSEKSIESTNDLDTQSRQLKKRRIGGEVSERKLNHNTPDITHKKSGASLPKRKKSVSFTPDTKAEDGDSAQTIQFLVPDSPGATPKKMHETTDTGQADRSPSKPKKDKKSKVNKNSSSKAPPRKATAALNYLNQYCFQRSTWKFNKNHETWILKHALSIDQIPTEQSLRLAFYLQGLVSPGARQRLAEHSRQALKPEESTNENDDALREKMQEVLGEGSLDYNEDSESLVWLKGTSRAKLILLCLGESSKQPHQQTPTNGQVPPRTKKNKSRTTRIEVDSSSSSESASSDSDSDTTKPVHSKRKPDVVSAVTSADGSSSESSSDSDDSSSEEASDTSSEGSSDSQ